MKKEKNNMEDGHLSFDPEQLKNATQEGHPNDEAYELLWEATCVSSHVDDVDKAAGSTSEDNVYPTTAEEVDRMEELVNKAAHALKEPDTEFSQRVHELRDIIAWSRKRHWKFNWRIIAGAILSAFLLPMVLGSNPDAKRVAANNVHKVEQWQEVELVHFDSFEELLKSDIESVADNALYDTPTNWYNTRLYFAGWSYAEALKEIAECEQNLNDESQEWRHEQIKEWKEKQEDRKEEALERFDDLKDLDYDDVKEMALEEAEDRVSAAKAADAFVNFIIICFVMMIPLYVFATRPYGYMISRYRREAKYMNKLEKFGLWLSGGMLSVAASIKFVDIVTKWSDGSTTREDDGTGPARIAIQVALFVGAVLVFCCVSSFLMIYATITGLYRNYDWKAVKHKVANLKGAQ